MKSNNKGKIFALLGLIGGAFLLFSSFAGSKTEVPDDTGNDINNPDVDPNDDPTITNPVAESTVAEIGAKFNIAKFLWDPRENSNMLTLVMQTPGKIQKGWGCEIKLPDGWSGIKYFNAKVTIRDIYKSNGVEYVQTSLALEKNNLGNSLLNYANAQFTSPGSRNPGKLIILSFTGSQPSGGSVTYTGVDLPIVRIVQAYKVVNGVRSYIVGHSFVVVRDRNYVLNRVSAGENIKLDQTANPVYNQRVVSVASIGERNLTTSERVIDVVMPFEGNNEGGQVLIVSKS